MRHRIRTSRGVSAAESPLRASGQQTGRRAVAGQSEQSDSSIPILRTELQGMAVVTADVNLGDPRRQVSASRNIRDGRLIDFVLGGPNYQIEHHLLPSMPRPNLRPWRPPPFVTTRLPDSIRFATIDG